MELLTYLQSNGDALVSEAASNVSRSHLQHYDEAGAVQTRARISGLFERLLESLTRRSLKPMVEHVTGLAKERFAAGYDLFEVQVAFNVLEEVVWRHILKALTADQLAEAIGMVSTVLGAGKDALARSYVELASKAHAPSIDLRALFAGNAA
jgi:hypothetical protein